MILKGFNHMIECYNYHNTKLQERQDPIWGAAPILHLYHVMNVTGTLNAAAKVIMSDIFMFVSHSL